jgi:hypothetical protein
MKNIALIIAVLYCFQTKAQGDFVKINASTSSILEFTTGTSNGILLPIVTSLPSSPTNGTLLMDKTDLKVKMRQNNTWVNLTDAGSVSNVNTNPTNETATNGIIIGEQTTNATGVLVLESSSKALVLPNIANPHTTVPSPYPGMICYDTVSKSVAIFDGLVWNYWK